MGVAMENAIPSVKDVANFVTKSNLEDGVAYAIEKFVLN
jgi:hydroxymethylpyrimidine pyrophosphatase-like HAD family hydrolase